MGKPLQSPQQYAGGPGEKSITCKGKTKNIKYKVDGYFEFKGRKYVCESMDLTFMDVFNVFQFIGKQQLIMGNP